MNKNSVQPKKKKRYSNMPGHQGSDTKEKERKTPYPNLHYYYSRTLSPFWRLLSLDSILTSVQHSLSLSLTHSFRLSLLFLYYNFCQLRLCFQIYQIRKLLLLYTKTNPTTSTTPHYTTTSLPPTSTSPHFHSPKTQNHRKISTLSSKTKPQI